MEKIVIWGVGNNWRQYKDLIMQKYEVVACVDKYVYDNKDVFPVEKIYELDFDTVLITPQNYEDIYNQLTDMGVSENQISVFVVDLLDEISGSKEIVGLRCYGQHFDDLIIAAILGQIGIDKPTYIDIGANFPFTYSNTAIFYQNGCRGVNIDANPSLINRFNKIRPADKNINVGVAIQSGELDFYMFDNLSGINTFSKFEVERWEKAGLEVKKIVKIPVITLQDIVDTYCDGVFPDFLDCDIEGLDYEVLETTNLDEGPKVICVEVRSNEVNRFDSLMDSKKYYRFCRIGENNVYVQKQYQSIVSHMKSN